MRKSWTLAAGIFPSVVFSPPARPQKPCPNLRFVRTTFLRLAHMHDVREYPPGPSVASGLPPDSQGSSGDMSPPEKGTVRFRLTDSSLLALHRGDITKWKVDGKSDAIVNAANTRMLGGGGVDGAIHRAAGPDLYDACLKLPIVARGIRCRTGDAVITNGYQLHVSKIIHAVGPIYVDDETSAPLLESAYKHALSLAVENGIEFLAFPAISCGAYDYPHDKASEISLRTVKENGGGLKEIHFVLFEEGTWIQWLSKANEWFDRVPQ